MRSSGLSCISDLAQKQQFQSTLGKRSPYMIGNKIQEERPYQVSQLFAFHLADTNFHQITTPWWFLTFRFAKLVLLFPLPKLTNLNLPNSAFGLVFWFPQLCRNWLKTNELSQVSDWDALYQLPSMTAKNDSAEPYRARSDFERIHYFQHLLLIKWHY